MRSFFKFIGTLFTTAIGAMLGLSLAFFLAVLIGVAILQDDNVVEIEDDTVLRISLQEEITEWESSGAFDPTQFMIDGNSNASLPLLKALKAIRQAATDDRIKGIALTPSSLSGGFASLTEIRNALIKFKQTSGKFIYAYSDNYSEGAYYVASVADSIYLHPQGSLEMNGIVSERMFYKGMFDKFGIKPEIFRVGTYKSAVEPYMLPGMSPESRYQAQVYLDSLNNRFLNAIAKSRNLTFDTLKAISNQMLVRNTADAVAQKLVTRLAYSDYFEDVMRTKLNIAHKEKIKQVSFLDYIEAEKPDYEEPDTESHIAVIVAEGTIMDGKESGNGEISGKYVALQIRKAREDEKVKAIVLRINSPGGSALASDMMWREVQLTKGVKPIIASMSDVAASGGYYMAMGCDKIVAMPNTITGSIGIFSVYFDAEGLLQGQLGITTDEVGTGTFSNIGSPADAFTDQERAILQKQIEEGYDSFTKKAADGRNLKIDSLRSLAQGRVWIGADALRIGLVDKLGSFDDAIDLAISSAGLNESDCTLKFYGAKERTPLQQILGGLQADWKEKAVKEELGNFYPLYQQVRRLQHLQGIQALMPYDVVVK